MKRKRKKTKEIAVRGLLTFGPLLPHPNWTKAQILQHADETYKDMELIREWLIEYLLKEKEAIKPSDRGKVFPW